MARLDDVPQKNRGFVKGALYPQFAAFRRVEDLRNEYGEPTLEDAEVLLETYDEDTVEHRVVYEPAPSDNRRFSYDHRWMLEVPVPEGQSRRHMEVPHREGFVPRIETLVLRKRRFLAGKKFGHVLTEQNAKITEAQEATRQALFEKDEAERKLPELEKQLAEITASLQKANNVVEAFEEQLIAQRADIQQAEDERKLARKRLGVLLKYVGEAKADELFKEAKIKTLAGDEEKEDDNTGD